MLAESRGWQVCERDSFVQGQSSMEGNAYDARMVCVAGER